MACQVFQIIKLENEDFDCGDILHKMNGPYVEDKKTLVDNKKSSMFNNQIQTPEWLQQDSYNCGIICLIKCLEKLTMRNILSNIQEHQ